MTRSNDDPGAAPTPRPDVWAEQRRLVTLLAAEGVGSAAAGALLWRRTRRRSVWRGVARQSVAWGAVNTAIAGWGAYRRGGRLAALADPLAPDVVAAERRALRRLLIGNAALDVGYVALGTARAVARTGAARGDGLAVVAQGLFLLGLDSAFARRLA